MERIKPKEATPGQKVTYQTAPGKRKEKGIINAIPVNFKKSHVVAVAYSTENDWSDYKEREGELTHIAFLFKGWEEA